MYFLNKTDKRFTCCFTGHRPQSLPFGFSERHIGCIQLKQALREKIIEVIEAYSVTHFISGLALGCDQYAAEIVLDLKNDYPHITLECALPCENQSEKWSETHRNRYFYILERCDKETLLQAHYTEHCMQIRNEYMVNESAYVIAVWNGKAGGTRNTIHYARKMEKQILIIHPNEFYG